MENRKIRRHWFSRPWRDFPLSSIFPALAALRAGLLSFAPSALCERFPCFSELTSLSLTLKIRRAIVQLDEPQPEFDHGDNGHVHKHRDNNIHAQFWRDGEIAAQQS